MITRLIAAGIVMALCVGIHASGLAWALRWLRRRGLPTGYLASLGLFVQVAAAIVFLHIVEILVWAALYVWTGALADFQTAVYFSAVTYTTTGYGDVVLPQGYRWDGGVEALTGILMCGWSTGFFFALVNRLYEPLRQVPSR